MIIIIVFTGLTLRFAQGKRPVLPPQGGARQNAKLGMPMTIHVRPMRPEEARRYLEVHRASVRGIAAKDYPSEVIEDWAPVPITDAAVKQILANPDNEIRLMAEIDGTVAGMGALVVERSELRACYVLPSVGREGVGTAIVREIERIARAQGLTSLDLEASVTSEPFYRALGYEVMERGEHVLQSGRRMAAVTMRKLLGAGPA